MTYANGDKMTAVYNGYGQMIAEKWYDRYDNRIAYYKYAYDSQGNIVRSIDILARKMYNYMYEDGKLTYACECKISLDSNNYIIAKTARYTVHYFYDNENNIVRKRTVFADGREQTVTYETAENETQLVKTAIGEHSFVSVAKTDSFGRKEFDEIQLAKCSVARKFDYLKGEATDEHIQNGKYKSVPTTQLVSKITFQDGRTTEYEYDKEERITKVIDSVEGVTQYTYDSLGQLLTETKNGETVNTMTYDNYGNILSKNGIGYVYNDKWKDRLDFYNGKAITYDAQGNPLTYLGNRLIWEKGRQLKYFDGNIYTYNANGIRTSKTIDGIRHDFCLDGAKILRETWNGNTLETIFDQEDSVCGIIYNQTPYYFVKNLQGDVIEITDQNGKTVARYSYDAWGKCQIDKAFKNSLIAHINPFRYRSYYYDIETGLYYLQSRYYDADTGRFLNSDMAKFAVMQQDVLAHNLFGYCGNEPIRSFDFTGHATTKICANGSFKKKYENQIKNSSLYKKYNNIFFFTNKKVKGRLSKKFDGGFYYLYGYYDDGNLFTQKGYRYTTYYFLTKKVSEWKKYVKSYNFSWIIKAMKIASFLLQIYSGTGYTKTGDAWMLVGETTDRVLEHCGNVFSDNLRGVVIDSMSRYISGKISGKSKNKKVTILMFAKTSVNLKKIFSNKWYVQDLFYGYPWEKKHYFIK